MLLMANAAAPAMSNPTITVPIFNLLFPVPHPYCQRTLPEDRFASVLHVCKSSCALSVLLLFSSLVSSASALQFYLAAAVFFISTFNVLLTL